MKIETSKGLWVSDMFTERFGKKNITAANTVPEFKILARDMTDEEVKSEIGAQDCTLADIAAFIKNPPKGTNDGMANLFYVASCVVIVFWFAGARKWDVSAWKQGGCWSAGRRVFSRNWHSETKTEALSASDTLTLELRVKKLEEWREHVLAAFNQPDV